MVHPEDKAEHERLLRDAAPESPFAASVPTRTVEFPGVTSRDQAERLARRAQPVPGVYRPDQGAEFRKHRSPVDVVPLPGLQEFPGVIPPRLMAMLTAFCVGVTESRLPNQEIGRAGSPYIDRWYLARKVQVPTFMYEETAPARKVAAGVGPLLPSELENVYLHGYHRGDADDPHDHPWPNASLVVRGWYRENLYDDQGRFVRCETRRPGDIVLRSAGSIHAILETSPDCLSLFATLRKCREWGFWRDGQFIHWKDFP